VAEARIRREERRARWSRRQEYNLYRRGKMLQEVCQKGKKNATISGKLTRQSNCFAFVSRMRFS